MPGAAYRPLRFGPRVTLMERGADGSLYLRSPQALGDYPLRVTDALSATADGLLSIYIPTPPLQITTLSLPNAQQGASYTNQLQASGGQLPYGWSLAPGSLNGDVPRSSGRVGGLSWPKINATPASEMTSPGYNTVWLVRWPLTKVPPVEFRSKSTNRPLMARS